MIQPFKQWNARILPQLNRLLAAFNKLDNLRGDEFIQVKKSGAGTTIGLNLNKARERLSRKQQESTSGKSRRAQCAADAGASSTILASLYSASTGILATSGDEFEVTVHCSVTGGADLNDALPRLEDGLDIPVYSSTFDNAGTPEPRWYFDGVFQESENCTCGA